MKEILLTQGMMSLVDDGVYELLSNYNWHLHRGMGGKYSCYAATTFDRHVILMHRMILGLEVGSSLVGHHIDGNGLNNQRSNLRAVTRRTNAHNQARRVPKNGYLGVSRHRAGWRATIHVGGKAIKLPTVKSPEEAAQMYQDARRHFFTEGQAMDLLH